MVFLPSNKQDKMVKEVKEYVEYIMWERKKRWIVVSEEDLSFRFKETRNKELQCGMCKLEVMIQSERRKRMELKELVNVLMVELEEEKIFRENIEVEVGDRR